MSETPEEAAEREQEKIDYEAAGRLAREEPLQKAARALLASVAASAIRLKNVTPTPSTLRPRSSWTAPPMRRRRRVATALPTDERPPGEVESSREVGTWAS